jgi:Integrase core domain
MGFDQYHEPANELSPETRPGFLEADLVAHCGVDIEGGYLYTLKLTDVATGWTECLPLLNRSQETVLAAIQRARTLFPFPILGIDTDNGGEFINEVLIAYCEQEQITFTRGRPYLKNDQCFVEQKNGAIVRQVRWSAMIAWLENTPIGNSPNSIGRCVCMSIATNPR